ncbi:MAG TPA: molybdopterin cofactor-binding domain-containing protein, partial [Candidatus Acidoferrales bacterium]
MKNPTHKGTEQPMEKGAAEAFERAGFSRRNFIKGTGALIVTFSMGGAVAILEAQNRPAPAGAGGGEGGAGSGDAPPAGEVDSWVAIGSDGKVTAYTGKEELGQGMSTAQTQLVAEEMCVPLERVNLIVCDTFMTPDQGVTSGSQSSPANFNRNNLAGACATAREALLALGAKQLNIPVEELVAVDGTIRSKSDASKKVAYSELVSAKNFKLKLNTAAKRKPASEWTILGKPIGRPDMAAMATGTFEYVQTVHVPGMLHG